MEKQYYIASGKEHLGPFSLLELKGIRLKPDTLIWYDGLEQWTNASEISELKTYTPPPTPHQINKGQNKSKLLLEKKLFIKALKRIVIFYPFIFILLFVVLGGFRDQLDLSKSLKDVHIYTTPNNVKAVIVEISLLWSFLFSIVLFGLFYYKEKQTIKKMNSISLKEQSPDHIE